MSATRVCGDLLIAAGPEAAAWLAAQPHGAASCIGDARLRARLDGGAQARHEGDVQAFGLYDLIAGEPADTLAACAQRRDPAPLWADRRGRFAEALWDGDALAVANDHFDTIPLYYLQAPGLLLVATRLRTLLAAPWCAREADPLAVYHYLNFSCIPAPATICSGVRRLPPGSVLRWRGGEVGITRYWRPTYAEDVDGDETLRARELAAQIRTSVEAYRPPADDRWGCFLSGGTDSSSVLILLSRQQPGTRVPSYSIGFAEQGYDELGFARIAAEAAGADAHYGVVDMRQTLDLAPRLADIYDQPFGNASAVPTYACLALARGDGVRTMLAGDGGDEIFGGNQRYAKDRMMDAYYRLPRPLKALGGAIGRAVSGGRVHLLNRIGNFVERAALPNPDRFYTDDSFGSDHYEALLAPEFAAQVERDASLQAMRAIYAEGQARAELHRLMYLDLMMAIAQNDLVKVHGAARAQGVDVRFPYLDPDLVEHTGSLMAHYKVRGLHKRYLFKRALADVLPQAIRSKKKQGFGLPIAVWMKDAPAFRALVTDTLGSRRARERGWFRTDFVERLLREHVAGAWDYSAPLWAMLQLELWLERHLDPN
ncbi:MAG: asparagine synthase-related protein [Mizugakiibacter sp.]|uniref:asparagine synthetase B family protein n=1 Tax=Mizugakiibacter sp. TaxID=1972610 RepID=UPI0031C82C3A|nr:hypothetical protein [Xanthomonadaceae bacterium]